jgi:hypothetical protein
MGRTLQTIPKEFLTKDEFYSLLIKHHKYTPEQISNMTPRQQLVAKNAIKTEQELENELIFETMEEYLAWKASK